MDPSQIRPFVHWAGIVVGCMYAVLFMACAFAYNEG